MIVQDALRMKFGSVRGGATLLSFSFLGSGALGLLRDRLLASSFGAGPELDVYLAAFRIPDFIHGIFVLGGVSAVFLPLFSEYAQKGEKAAWEFANSTLQALLVGLGLLALGTFFLVPLLIDFIAPGFSAEQQELAVPLTRLMLLSPILFGISSVFSGVLQYFQRLLAYAAAPVLYNLGIIFGILFLAPTMGIWGVGWGVILGALLHLSIQIPSVLLSGFSWSTKLNLSHPALAHAARLAVPRTIGGAAYHLNIIAMTAYASLLSVGSITVFSFANNLQQFPINMIGIPFALAAFPVFSKSFAEGNWPAFRSALSSSLSQIILLLLPVSLVLFAFREKIIFLLYRSGAYEASDAKLTAAVLGIFSVGIMFQAVIPLFARAFFALQDTKTPTIIGLVSVAASIGGAGLLLWINPPVFSWMAGSAGDARVLALPFALVGAGALQAFFLILAMNRKLRKGKLTAGL